ncbi:hypothetical protein RHMOL_Rhmol01G0204700 [Rhododendron molle]|uniref:Uncharacterized protein n=1 Tax=Rhododendron molle TaxID=49168 RepID=A0ACC0Q3G7_RHOML|nr:hypothetical protein RHMOL_Rhmol01G0204700 [Rhododendron molle]
MSSPLLASPFTSLQCLSSQKKVTRKLIPLRSYSLGTYVNDCTQCEDLSLKAKSRFSISLRNLSQPWSLGEIAKTWDACARAVMLEYAQRSGGGSFSSIYGMREDCLSAT